MIQVNPPLTLGLTGGIGSGKSTVAGLLATMGASVIDADAISRQVTAEGGAAIAALQAKFGPAILTPDRALDRDAMRQRVFTDQGARKSLEDIVHPLVKQAMVMQAELAQTTGARCIVFDIPLLVESGQWRRTLQRVLVVDCTMETQITRVLARDKLTEAGIQKIIDAQASRATRLKAADWVLYNDGISKDCLGQQIHEIAAQFGL